MPGSSDKTDCKVSSQEMIKKCAEVLSAGGTVYLGENHTESDARDICCEVLEKRCVQYLCLEFDSSCQDIMSASLIDTAERVLGHNPPKKMSEVMEACTDSNGNTVLVDKQTGTTMTARQIHISEQIKSYRGKVTLPGRGVLVLIGSDHLKNIHDKRGQWRALHELVYDGLSFEFGWSKSCKMVWQLS